MEKIKEKISIVVIVFVAVWCLFGCSESLPEEEMVYYIQAPSNVRI